MSKVLVTDTYLNNIADSIRAKLGVSTTYKCFFYAHPVKALIFLCELLNEDIEKKAQRKDQLQQVKVKVDGKEIILFRADAVD